ncbi:MAG: hypothetical protein ACI3WU_01045 [Phascolarctobacterium sp.]
MQDLQKLSDEFATKIEIKAAGDIMGTLKAFSASIIYTDTLFS